MTKFRTLLPAATLLLFAIVFTLIALPNHLCFRTYCLDMGIYTKALYDYAHLAVCDCSMAQWQPICILADHFDLWLVVLSPLVYLFGQYTLMAVQIAFALIGAWGMYKLIGLYTSSSRTAYLAMLSLLCFFGLWQALAFDYHSNVCAAMLLPWLLWAVKKERYGWLTLLTLLICTSKESDALWMVFVMAALLIDYWSQPRTRWWLLAMVASCIAYLAVVTKLVMPNLPGAENARGWWRYEYMGGSLGEIAAWGITHPWQLLQNFMTDFYHHDGMNAVGLKTTCLVLLLTSGLALLVLKPNYLVMLIPPLMLKWLAADEGFWGIAYHYNIEFGPVLVAGAFIVIAGLKRERLQRHAATAMAVLTLLSGLYTCFAQTPYVRLDNVNIFRAGHYRTADFDGDAARRMLSMIPADASVCANTFFTPHLACRDSVYNFPIGLAHNPKYLLLLRKPHFSYYDGEYETAQRLIADHEHYRIVANSSDLYLLKRRHPHDADDFVRLHDGQFCIGDSAWFPIMLNYKPDMCDKRIAPSEHYGTKPLAEQLHDVCSWGFNSLRLCIDQQDDMDTTRLFPSLDSLLLAAEEEGLRVMLLLRPPLDETTTATTIALLRHCSHNATVWAYDFMNEPLYFDTIPDRDKHAAAEIAKQWRQLRDRYAPHQLFTIAFAEPLEVFEWDPSMLCVDFVEMHTYNPLRVASEMYWYGHYCGKPWIVGETSLPADNDSVPYRWQAIFMRESLLEAVRNGAIGYGWWEYADRPDGVNFEAQYSGLIDNSGKAKFDVKQTLAACHKAMALGLQARTTPPPTYYNMLGYSNLCVCGTVVDTTRQQPIEGAVVCGWNDDWSVGVNTFTDSKGRFTLVSNDICTNFEVSAPGYQCVKMHLLPPYNVDAEALPNRGREYQTIDYRPFLASGTSLLALRRSMFRIPTTQAQIGEIVLELLK